MVVSPVQLNGMTEGDDLVVADERRRADARHGDVPDRHRRGERVARAEPARTGGGGVLGADEPM